MKVDQSLFDAAADQLSLRWPSPANGVAAAVYLDDGAVLTGVDFHDLDQRRLWRRLSDIAAALDDGELSGVPTTQPRRTGGSGSERLTD